MKQHYQQQGTKANVQSIETKVGSRVPALRLTATYHGAFEYGFEVGEVTEILYFFVQGNVLYEFASSTVTPWSGKDIPIFKAAARSIHFTPAA